MDKIKYLQTEEYSQYKTDIMDILQCILEMFKENNDCLPEELEAFYAFADDQV